MNAENEITDILTTAREMSPTGFVTACHIHFTTPRILIQTYDPKWIATYSERGFVMSDPTVIWGMQNDGFKKWSDLTDMDAAGVLSASAKHGMKFGTSCAVENGGSRSIGGFSRPDREFENAEDIAHEAALLRIHDLTSDMPHLPPSLKTSLIADGFLVHDLNG